MFLKFLLMPFCFWNSIVALEFLKFRLMPFFFLLSSSHAICLCPLFCRLVLSSSEVRSLHGNLLLDFLSLLCSSFLLWWWWWWSFRLWWWWCSSSECFPWWCLPTNHLPCYESPEDSLFPCFSCSSKESFSSCFSTWYLMLASSSFSGLLSSP